MPTYQAPGVYVEEVSFTAPTIEGVGTTTTAFVGPTLTGPVGGVPYGGLPASGSPVAGTPSGGVPQLLTSFGDFQNIYGGFQNLGLAGTTAEKQINYMANAVQAFFTNGGSSLYVSRVFTTQAGGAPGTINPGVATSAASSATTVVVGARFPGAALNGQQVTIAINATRLLNFNNLQNLPSGSVLGEPGATPTFFANGTGNTFMSNAAVPAALTAATFPAKLYALTVTVTAPGAANQLLVYDNLGLDPAGPNYIGTVLGANPPRPIDALQNQIWLHIGSSLNTGFTLLNALFPVWNDPSATPALPTPAATFTLSGGNDGAEPVEADYANAFSYLKALEDIAIVGTPGSSIYTDATNILIGAVLPHVEAQRAYRVAVLEAGPHQLDSQYEDVRAHIDSSYAALYVPWIYVPNPLAGGGTSAPSQIMVPPTGSVAGIYARNDTQRSVAKAPANEVVIGAVELERHINFAEQALLNPLGINCIRYFPDRGFRVWGARTVSSDSELKYVNVRRFLVYLEHSIDNGTQWAVFENNGPALWARVTDSIDSFLNNEFKQGNLLGTTPAEAYFVRCDRTTMTQNDLDNGRLICLVGVALLKPAEFVIFRIGQKTATAKS